MLLKSLTCPNCGASLDVDDGLDTFFCKYCGHKILLEGQSKEAYDAKVRVKEMEHKERLRDKRDAQERYRMEFKQNDEKKTITTVFSILGAIFALCLIGLLFINSSANRQDQKLQDIVDQIMIDIENEDFAAAYVKANKLYWDDTWSDRGEKKWNATRKEIIKQIQKAEKTAAATSKTSFNEDIALIIATIVGSPIKNNSN